MSDAPTIDITAPANEDGTTARILRWCKSLGEAIRQDEPLLELETDKVTVEIPAPVSGELIEILTGPSEEVKPGQLLARLRSGANRDGDAVASHESAPPTGPLSPAVRRLLAQHALDARELMGSGEGGRITVGDIERYLAQRAAAAPAAESSDASTRQPHTPIRRRVAEHMARSLAESPHVTTLFEVDLGRVEAHRALHRADCMSRGVHLTLTAYFVLACARGLARHPAVNATYHEDALELHADVNIGIGTALGDEGLIVPVIRGAQRLDLETIARRLGELVEAARSRTLRPQDVRGGTFTISNHGVSGSLLAAPIVLHQPQVAILGVGKVERRVRVLENAGAEAIAVRSMCYLTLSIDHRALDAHQANAFMTDVKNTLEHWS